MILRRLAWALLSVAVLALPPQALAASKVRIEWVRTAPAASPAGAPGAAPSALLGAESLTVTGSTPMLSTAAPDFKTDGYGYRNGYARVTVVSGSVLANWGAAPSVTETAGLRLEAGAERYIALETGIKLVFIEPADAAAVALPSGAATAANQASANTKLDTLHADLTGALTTRGAAPASPATATIASSGSLSAAVDLDTERAHRLALPAAWTAAAITFQVSPDGVTYYDLYTELGEYSLSSSVVGASRSIVLDQGIFYGVRYLKVRSGTSAAPVAQAASRAITVVTVPR